VVAGVPARAIKDRRSQRTERRLRVRRDPLDALDPHLARGHSFVVVMFARKLALGFPLA